MTRVTTSGSVNPVAEVAVCNASAMWASLASCVTIIFVPSFTDGLKRWAAQQNTRAFPSNFLACHRTAPFCPNKFGASLWQRAAEVQQRREIKTGREVDCAESSEESPRACWVPGGTEKPTGTLIANNAGTEVVRE